MTRFALLLALLALGGCQRTMAMTVTLLPDGRVQLTLPDDEPGCFDNLFIRHAESTAPDAAIWEIERQNDAPCTKQIVFPEVPAGFTAYKPARPLTPGLYWITGHANGASVSGDLEVPPR